MYNDNVLNFFPSEQMIKVTFWARAKEQAQTSTQKIPTSTLSTALHQLRTQYPDLQLEDCMYAVNMTYTDDMDMDLVDGDSLDIIPPVNGG